MSSHNARSQGEKNRQAPAGPSEGEVQRMKPLSSGKAVTFILAGLVLAVVLGVLGIVPRLRAQKHLQQQTTADAAPDVLVDKPTVGKPEDTLVLPGALQAYIDSPIYSRSAGYITHWYADIGAHVKTGQLLAVVASPEVDQQLAQAQAALATAQANQKQRGYPGQALPGPVEAGCCHTAGHR